MAAALTKSNLLSSTRHHSRSPPEKHLRFPQVVQFQQIHRFPRHSPRPPISLHPRISIAGFGGSFRLRFFARRLGRRRSADDLAPVRPTLDEASSLLLPRFARARTASIPGASSEGHPSLDPRDGDQSPTKVRATWASSDPRDGGQSTTGGSSSFVGTRWASLLRWFACARSISGGHCFRCR